MGSEFPGGDILKLMGIVAQLCEHTKTPQFTHFQSLNFMVCEWYGCKISRFKF